MTNKFDLIPYFSPETIKIDWPELKEAGVTIHVRNEYANSVVSGNKYWKLKYNLDQAVKEKATTLLTFGGAYSNMIHATAAAAHLFGLHSIGIIRGEEIHPLNETLEVATRMGMRLHFVSREKYRDKNDASFISDLKQKFGEFYLLPEGGTNELAVRGCREWARLINDESNFDYVCVPVGTGGTLAGLIAGFEGQKKIIGFSSLKGGDFLVDEVKLILTKYGFADPGNWSIETRFHFGGYGKSSGELQQFIVDEKTNNSLPLDRVYTSKMMFGIKQLVKEGFFRCGSTVLALHTGGLQEIQHP